MSQTAQDHNSRGVEYCKKEDFTAAVECFSQALSVEKHHTDALYNRAKSYFKLKLFEESLRDFSALIEKNPDNAFYYSERAVAFHLSGDNVKSLEDLDKAVELEPHKPFRYSSRAFIKERSGDLKGAIADYQKTVELDPEDAIAFNNKGLVEEKLGYKEQSKRSFEQADHLDHAYDASKMSNRTVEEPIKTETSKGNKTTPASPEKLTFKNYMNLIKGIVSTKSERKEFKEFLKGFLKRKK